MSDTDELRALLQRYTRFVDARELESLRALFAPEAVIGGSRGSQTLDEWLASLAAPRAFASSMHLYGDPLIKLDPSGHEARLDTYGVVYQLAEPTSERSDLTLGVRMSDVASKRDGTWVFLSRSTDIRWMR